MTKLTYSVQYLYIHICIKYTLYIHDNMICKNCQINKHSKKGIMNQIVKRTMSNISLTYVPNSSYTTYIYNSNDYMQYA